MKLSKEGLKNRAEWEAKGYKLPQFDRDAVTAATKENPFWIHFGAGNIFRIIFHRTKIIIIFNNADAATPNIIKFL